MNDMDDKIFSPFGPSIYKVKIPKNLQDELNKYVEEVIKNKNKQKSLIMEKILLEMLIKKLS